MKRGWLIKIGDTGSRVLAVVVLTGRISSGRTEARVVTISRCTTNTGTTLVGAPIGFNTVP